MDSSPDPALVEKSSLSPSLSGSIVNRLSASSSLHRLRAGTKMLPVIDVEDANIDVPIAQPKTYSNVGLGILTSDSSTALLPAPTVATSHRASSNWSFSGCHIFRWILTGYCLFSVLFFTFILLHEYDEFLGVFTENTPSVPLSAINSLPSSFKLSKLTRINPAANSFDPNVLQSVTSPDLSDITACLWSEGHDLKRILDWSSSWKGPISLLLVTSSEPLSASRQLLLKELTNLHKTSSIKSKLSVHVLEKIPSAHLTPNAYLNMARLFSQTSYVVLYPMRPTVVPPKQLYDDVQHYVNVSSSKKSEFLPTVLASSSSNGTAVRFPFPPSTPVLLDVDNPVWCTERFFTAPSRSADWEECMWQMWINSLGNMRFLPKSKSPPVNWQTDDNSDTRGDRGSVKDKIHRRLSTRFRHETCVMVSKNIKGTMGSDAVSGNTTLTPSNRQTFRWLRQVCKQAANHT